MIINVKPLSVNKCWQGRRFKTQEYKDYEREVLFKLKHMSIPAGKLKIVIEAGFSNKNSDIDNIAKPFVDILQKKYNFNDNRIYKLTLIKSIVKKGDEYMKFEITEIKGKK